MQQNSKCRLCRERDEMFNHIVSKCSKLAQKEYLTRYDWVEKKTRWELCKKLKFNYTIKWYVHKPESILEYEMHKILLDFEIKMDHLISARRPDLVLINKKRENLASSGFCHSSQP